MILPDFSSRLIAWQKQYGRHHFPWQTDDAYCVWLSEIMLQQTQTVTVAEYYPRFLAAFPTVRDLAAAEQEQVLALWAGLGYYSRARNLHKAARQIVAEFGGTFPQRRTELEKLCGVGRSTAAAIAAFAFRQRETILDGNVKRVLCRVFAQDGNPADKRFERQLWLLAESLLPENGDDMPAYTQGLMDLGATVCTRSKPVCEMCPMNDVCQARKEGRIGELPRKKTPLAIKQQTVFWLLLQRDDGAVWLQKRPQKGIWAGLYCLPESDRAKGLAEYAGNFAAQAADWEELPTIWHRLTHRLLEIIPFYVRVPCSERLPEKVTGQWVLPAKLPETGMPKPLQSLLENGLRVTHNICG